MVKYLFIFFLFNLYSPLLADSDKKDIKPQYLPIEAQWCFEGRECILLEVANEDEEKVIGLMMREKIPKGTGMIFVFSPPRIVHFWMHKTLIPLDMIFFANHSIVSIETNVQTCFFDPCSRYGPDKPVNGVIELAAGEVKRLQIKVGDMVEIRQTKKQN